MGAAARGGAAEFLQTYSDNSQKMNRVMSILRGGPGNNPSLKVLALKVPSVGGDDRFKRVRKIIADMVANLEKQLKEFEAENQGCKKKVTKTQKEHGDALKAEDEAGYKVHKASEAIADAQEAKKQLKQNVKKMEAAQKKEQKLFDQQDAEHKQTIEDGKRARQSVKDAMETLGCTGKFFLQKGAESYKPKNSNRDGNTVDSLAPDSLTSGTDDLTDMGGKSGICGLLEVILADVKDEIKTTKKNQKKATDDWEAEKENYQMNIENDNLGIEDENKNIAEGKSTKAEGQKK